jgi:hypothetical protein
LGRNVRAERGEQERVEEIGGMGRRAEEVLSKELVEKIEQRSSTTTF